MRTHTGVATRMFGALAERGINITLINTSEVRINVGTDIARAGRGSTASQGLRGGELATDDGDGRRISHRWTQITDNR